MTLIFCRSNTVGSWLIRLLTFSKWSHVAVVRPDGRAVEAVWPCVRITPLHDILRKHDHTELRTFGPFTNPYGMPEKPDRFDVEAQLGKPYDVFGVLMFVNPWRRWRQDDKWFCSELIAQATEMFDECDRVSPQMLYLLSKPFGGG